MYILYSSHHHINFDARPFILTDQHCNWSPRAVCNQLRTHSICEDNQQIRRIKGESGCLNHSCSHVITLFFNISTVGVPFWHRRNLDFNVSLMREIQPQHMWLPWQPKCALWGIIIIMLHTAGCGSCSILWEPPYLQENGLGMTSTSPSFSLALVGQLWAW